MIRKCLVLIALAVAMAVSGAVGWAQDSGGRSTASKAAKATAASPVNLNAATAVELQTLPGVGPALATRVLEYRQKNGGFKKIEDLMNVTGIGEKSFLKLKPLITVTTPKPPASNEK